MTSNSYNQINHWRSRHASKVAMQTERLDLLFSRVTDIPTLPGTVLRILDMLENSDCSVGDVSKVLVTDPPISAKVLRLANSSYYGFRQKITSIPQAATLLGLLTLKNTLLSASLIKVYAGARAGIDLPALWTHSFGVATAAKMVAKCVRYSNYERAFSAGLLHDIGKIIISRYLRTEQIMISGIARDQKVSIGEAEEFVLGINHADVGAWVLQSWHLPNCLVEAVEYHHCPTRSQTNFDICGIVYLANILAHRAGLGSGGDDLDREIDPAVMRYFELTEDDIVGLREDLQERRGEIASLASASATGM